MKKLLTLAISFLIIISTVPCALALPSDTVVIGNKAFALDLFFQDPLPDAITNALSEGGDIYFDIGGYGYMDAYTGDQMPETVQSSLSNIEYMNSDGSVCVYASFNDSEPIASAKVSGEVQLTTIGSITIARIYVNSADVGSKFSYNGSTKWFGEYIQLATTDLTSVDIELLNPDGQLVGTINVWLYDGYFESAVTLVETP